MGDMSTNAIHRLIEEYMDARNARDRGRIAEMMTDDVVYIVPRSHDLEPFQGEAAVDALSGGLTGTVFDLSTIKREVTRITAHGDVVAVEQTMSGTTYDGKDYTGEYVWIYELRDGKIARVIEHMDTLSLSRLTGRR